MKKDFEEYKKTILPPYSAKDIPSVALSLLFLALIFQLFIVMQNNPANYQSNAASSNRKHFRPTPTTIPTATPAVSVSPFPTSTPSGAITGRSGPYMALGWASPQDPVAVMTATGIKEFTLAFIVSGGGCTSKWDGTRPLLGGSDALTISRIRAAGGDIVPSFGGAAGTTVEEACSTASQLAGAYQSVINAYALKAIDIDTESASFYNSSAFRHKIVDALKIVQTGNPNLNIYVTFGGQSYSLSAGADMVQYAAAIGLDITAWTSMPFDFGSRSRTNLNMVTETINSTETLKTTVASAYHYDDSAAYRHVGISSMNGNTDERNEVVSLSDWQAIINYAKTHQLGRLSFWNVNRDRPCTTNLNSNDVCSGVPQNPLDYTRMLTQF